MRIAIVEDERALAEALAKGLATDGHETVIFPTATEASVLEREGNQYDLIMLDLMLPDGNGSDICLAIREAGVRTPILVLTARDSVEDRVELLDRGADDFLGKPFSFAELLARVRALSRRGPPTDDADITIGELRLSPAKREAYRGASLLSLTAREFDLLAYLMRNEGRVVDRAELMSKVWHQDGLGHTNVVDVHVRKLRVKVDEGHETAYIRTIHGVGYTIAQDRA